MNSPARGPRAGWRRLWRRRSLFAAVRRNGVLGREAFQTAIAKERCRAERRDLTFCIIRFDFENFEFVQGSLAESTSRLTESFRQRLRITDEIGEFEGSLGVLLPETLPSQAAQVANDLTRIARELNYDISTDIFVWPVPDDQAPGNRSGNRDGSFRIALEDAENNGNGNGNGHGNGHAGNRHTPADSSGNAHSVALASRPGTAIASNSLIVWPLNLARPVPWWKRTIDVVGAGSGLILLSPVFAGASLAIWLTSPGPVIFRQWREGKEGQLFRIYKFRTMRVGAENEQHRIRSLSEQDGPAFKIKDDPRLTRCGKILRRLCIDELPQLINVLKGEMSLVGPRPLPAEESLDCSCWQRRRLDVLPGMTCFWQVSGGRDVPFNEWMRMDLRYVRGHGLLTDAGLLLRTLVRVLHRGSV